MHGRVKVKTSAEKAEQKRRERVEKLKEYKEISSKVNDLAKNSLNEEFLSLSANVLALNPDNYTVWNLRREAILAQVGSSDDSEVTAIFERELKLSEDCIMKQPKSYSAWFQRYWVAKNFPGFQWKRDLALTQKALERDERNFHCWNYRRFLVMSGVTSPSDELDFTQKLIEKNFSNYSSWHERSRLLPNVHPGEKHIISEEALKKELQLIENAAFTDPDDQTVWIYLPWLIDSSRDIKVNRVTSISVLGDEIFLFVRSAVGKDDEIITQTVASLGIEGVKAVGFLAADFSRVWRLSDAKNGTMPSVSCIADAFRDQNPQCRSLSEREGLITFAASNGAIHDQISGLVSSCKQLLDLEPRSKWANYFYAFLLECTNFEEKFDTILSLYEKFLVLDPLRKGFHADMRSKLIFKALASSCELVSKLMLSSRGLTSIHFVPQLLFVKEVDLSRNKLTNTRALGTMLSVKRLILDSNRIKTLDGLQALNQLEVLSLADNRIEEVGELGRLKELRCLMQLNIVGNPVANVPIGDFDEVIPNSVELIT